MFPNNIDLNVILNNKKKNWIKKYYKIIKGLKTIADIQLQLQNIVWLAKVANTQFVKVKDNKLY